MTPGTEKVREWAGIVAKSPPSFRPWSDPVFGACLAYGAYLRGLLTGYSKDRGMDLIHAPCHRDPSGTLVFDIDLRTPAIEALAKYIAVWKETLAK